MAEHQQRTANGGELSELSILDGNAQNMSQQSFDLMALQQPRQTERQSSQISCSDLHFAKIYERLEKDMVQDTSEQVTQQTFTHNNSLAESMYQPKLPRSPRQKSPMTARTQPARTAAGITTMLQGRGEKPKNLISRGRSLKSRSPQTINRQKMQTSVYEYRSKPAYACNTFQTAANMHCIKFSPLIQSMSLHKIANRSPPINNQKNLMLSTMATL